MPLKKVRLAVTVGVLDETVSVPARYDADGRLISGGQAAARLVPPGEEVTLEAAEADRLLALFGPYRERIVEDAPAKSLGG